MTEFDDEPSAHGETVPVTLPSGGIFYIHPQEVAYIEERVHRYTADNKFTNISDQQDVDRMLIMELLVWRWSQWLTSQMDYWGEPVDANEMQKSIKEHSAELRQLKKQLGIDKASRDKERGEDSVVAYLENLRARAREFGYKRNAEASKSIELFQQVTAINTLYWNCTPEERRENHCTAEDIMEMLRDVVIPQFQEIDEKFRAEQQRYWVRSM